MDLRSKIRLLAGTFVLAAVISYLLMIVIPYYLFLLVLVILWPTLYFYWPQVRWLTFVKLSKAPRRPLPPAPERPFWPRLVRGTLKSIGGIALALALISMSVAVPIGLCLNRAKNAHNAIHIGMTVPEVLHAVTDYDIFGASSEIPHDDKADAENIPALNLGKGKDGIYQMYDLGLSQGVRFSESEAIRAPSCQTTRRLPMEVLLHVHQHDSDARNLQRSLRPRRPRHRSEAGLRLGLTGIRKASSFWATPI